MLSCDLLRQGHELTGREALFIHISDCLRVLQNSRSGLSFRNFKSALPTFDGISFIRVATCKVLCVVGSQNKSASSRWLEHCWLDLPPCLVMESHLHRHC
jgi:hypothetical protein